MMNREDAADAMESPAVGVLNVGQVLAIMLAVEQKLGREWKWRPFKGLLSSDKLAAVTGPTIGG